MSDTVRIIVSIAAQWRVVRALGPSALALAGVPVAGPKRPARPNAPGAPLPQNGHKAWK